jgi:DNA-binding transcriptional ArsR family regulator
MIGHPLRARILLLLREEGSMTPTDASEWLGATIGTTSYHFRQLAAGGLLRLEEQYPVRGSMAHVYGLTEEARIVLGALEALDPLETS